MNAFEGLDLDVLATRRSHKWRRYPPDVLPAFVAEMDYDLAGPVAAALRAAVDRQDCGYANESGLGEVFAGFAAVRHDWTVDPGRVYLLPDVMAGVDTMLRLATGPGDGGVINPPVYPPFYEHIAARGRTVVEVPLIRGQLDFAGLEAAFAAGARAYLLCNPHNPTGRVFSADDLRLIAELAGRYRVTVIADEIHAPLALAGARHTPFVSFAEGAAVGVTLASASKAFNIAGLKCAVAVAGSASMDRVLAAAPESLDRMRTLFGTLLAERLPGAGYVPPEAGYLAWVDCSALGLGAEPAAAFLNKGRVAVGRGLDFGAVGDGFVRVTIGTSSAILTEIVDRMAMAAG